MRQALSAMDAEMKGDITGVESLALSSRYPEDFAVLRKVSGHGKPVIRVLVSGRPMYANDLLNLSDAFVGAWLPGTSSPRFPRQLAFRLATHAVSSFIRR
jgi:hypothetical protein